MKITSDDLENLLNQEGKDLTLPSKKLAELVEIINQSEECWIELSELSN